MTATRQKAAPITDYSELRDSTVEAMSGETGLNLRYRPVLGLGERQIAARIVSQGLLARLQEQGIEGVDMLTKDLEVAIEDDPRTSLLDLAVGYERPVNQGARTQNERQRMAELAQAVGGTAETVTASMLGSQEVKAVAYMAGQMINSYDDPTIRGRKATREVLRHYVQGAVTAAGGPERTAA